MSEQHEPQSSSVPASREERQPVAGRLNARRRQLLRGGLATAPALLALKSSPVLACNCKLPSGFSVSGNLSRGVKNCAAPCDKPSVWKASKCSSSNPYYYNGTSVPKTRQFGTCTVNSVAFKSNSNYLGTDSVNTCLGKGDLHSQALCSAVYLESLVSGGTNFPTPQMVLDMWNNGVIGAAGYTVPGSTTKWNSTDVQNYFLYLTGQKT